MTVSKKTMVALCECDSMPDWVNVAKFMKHENGVWQGVGYRDQLLDIKVTVTVIPIQAD